MRNWINLFESLTPTTVYHGGCGEITLPIVVPFFTTPVYEMAESYARIKGREEGRVTSFTIDLTAKTAGPDVLNHYATERGMDWSGGHHSDLTYDLSDDLIRDGYQIVSIHDFGYHDDHREEQTYIVLDASVLSDMKHCADVADWREDAAHLTEGKAFHTKDGREITIHHAIDHEESDDENDIIDVYAMIDGETVGSGKYDEDACSFRGISVRKDFRRQGVATAIYDYLEGMGYHVRTSGNLEPDGELFWAARRDRK